MREMTTLLTQGCKPPTGEELIQRKKAEQALDVCRLILEETLAAYADGEITFESAIRTASCAIHAEDIPDDSQYQKMLGAFVDQICKTTPQTRQRTSTRKNPAWLQRTAAGLVRLANEREGLPIARESKTGKTAFDRAAEILKIRGIPATQSMVERAYLNADTQ
jgi:hypothetical protein